MLDILFLSKPILSVYSLVYTCFSLVDFYIYPRLERFIWHNFTTNNVVSFNNITVFYIKNVLQQY